jgi:hypothetical protein
MDTINPVVQHREPWNKGKLVGQKSPFKLKEIWQSGFALNLIGECANSRFSTLR